MRRLKSQKTLMMRALSVVFSFGLSAACLTAAGSASAADAITTIATSYQPTINETIDASGFKHPGVGLTKEILENMRAGVRGQKEPWNTYFNQTATSFAASRTIGPANNGGDFNSKSFNSKFITDGLRAYTQAVLYYVTGDDVYRANALRIIRVWSQMNPATYAYFDDAHIHTGIPLNRMVAAAEILRYTSTQTPDLEWTAADTANFSANLVNPVIEHFQHTNYRFMNQHLYPLIGAMSGYIFTGNRERYNEGVEWLTVNKTAVDQGQNGSIKQLFRLVDKNDVTGEAVNPPVVQHVEMGRDQAHGAGDVTNMGILARLLLGQGTKVDPVTGTASTAPNALDPYEFLNDRILDATEFFSKFMIGYEVPWVPTASHTDADGNPTIVYKQVSGAYRGRLTQNTWEPFYHYKYVKGINIEERAPYFTKMFSMRPGYNWDGVDGGGDFWLFIPPGAEAEGGKYLAKPIVNPIREIEDRTSSFDTNSAVMLDGSVGFVRVTATPAGTRIAHVGAGYGTSLLAFKVRTNGVAVLEAFNDTITLPDTKGQWRYVTAPYGMGDLLYMTIKGAGTTVDIDHINGDATNQLSAPAFTNGAADLSIFAYTGSTETISLNLAATDAVPTDVITYQIDHLPAGAVFSSSTGAFSWKPDQAGTYLFVVSASDGTTVTTKDIKIVVSTDRQSSVNAAIAAFDPAMLYLSGTLATYNAAHADAMNVISTATDDVFYQKLAVLNTAVLGLKQLTPLIYDGSMNYASVVASTTFSPDTWQAQDNNPDSFVGYFRAIDRTHTLDFGAGYKVSANEFQLQVRASFPERIGGVAIFGSNDNETWTRLTPGMTVVMDEMQSLPVQDDLKNLQFRFLKLQMIQPSSTMFELSEFRIFGLRHETINQISSVSMSSAQNLRRRVIAGDTVKLNFQSTNPINNVNVMIQGKPATVTTTDNLNWVATWVVDGTAAAGPVKFKLNYKTEAGQDAIETFGTTDGTSLFISDQSALMTNLLEVTSLKDSSGRNPADLLATVNLLLDKNLSTITDFRLNGSGAGAYLIFDFKEGGLATLSKVEVISRQDNTSGRINGTVVQGSNDGTAWDTISNAAFNSADWQTLTINTAQPYRYIRMYNGNTWFGNMAELRLHGTSISTNKIATASISSDQHLRTRIVPGNTVKVAFTAKEAINDVKATIQGQAATVTTTDNINFLATAAMPQGVAAGTVKFDIGYKLASGEAGVRNTSTTDNSKLYLVDESDVIRNLPVIATLIDSSVGRPMSTTVGQVNNLADGNLFSISDFRIGSNNSGTGSYITFDFKEGNQVNLTGVELAPRQDSNFGRIRGTVVQGSNDNVTWTSLTADAVSTMDWQNLPVSSPVPYRYIRLINGFAWFGNMSEIRLHGNVHGADVTAPVTTANAPAGWVKQDTTVTLVPSDAGAGVKATYYTVDGGAQQTGTSVTLSAEGAHALVYWSVDWAGNVEAQKTATVNIDKTAPVTTATASPVAPANGWYASDVSIVLSVNADAGSSATSYYTVNGGAQQTGNTVALSEKGTHTVAYWSADQAGNAEAPRSLTFNIGPIDVSASVKMTQLGTVYNRRAGRHIGGITVTNTSGATLTGPLHLKLNGLAAEFTLDNASGMHGGVPYVTLTSALNPGASITLPLTFNGPVRSTVSYTPTLLKGNF